MASQPSVELLRPPDSSSQGRHACIRSPQKTPPIHMPRIPQQLPQSTEGSARISEEQLHWAQAIINQAQLAMQDKIEVEQQSIQFPEVPISAQDTQNRSTVETLKVDAHQPQVVQSNPMKVVIETSTTIMDGGKPLLLLLIRLMRNLKQLNPLI